MLKTPAESHRNRCAYSSVTLCWLSVPRGAPEVDGKSGQLAPCRMSLHLRFSPCRSCCASQNATSLRWLVSRLMRSFPETSCSHDVEIRTRLPVAVMHDASRLCTTPPSCARVACDSMLASQGGGARAASAHAQTRNWELQTLKSVQGSRI